MCLCRRHPGHGLVHTERLQNAFLHELARIHARHQFDDVTLHVNGNAIDVLRAGLVEQRNLGKPGNEVGQLRVVIGQTAGAIQFVDRGVAEYSVGEAGGVLEQVVHRRRTNGIFEDDVALFILAGVHLYTFKFGNELRDRVTHRETTFLIENHHAHPNDGLGHGVDTEQRVVVDRVIGRAVREADVFMHDDFSAPGHDNLKSCRPFLFDEALEMIGNSCQPFGGHADLFGRHDIERSRRRCHGYENHGDRDRGPVEDSIHSCDYSIQGSVCVNAAGLSRFREQVVTPVLRRSL